VSSEAGPHRSEKKNTRQCEKLCRHYYHSSCVRLPGSTHLLHNAPAGIIRHGERILSDGLLDAGSVRTAVSPKAILFLRLWGTIVLE
jgi:hypothetical protein